MLVRTNLARITQPVKPALQRETISVCVFLDLKAMIVIWVRSLILYISIRICSKASACCGL